MNNIKLCADHSILHITGHPWTRFQCDEQISLASKRFQRWTGNKMFPSKPNVQAKDKFLQTSKYTLAEHQLPWGTPPLGVPAITLHKTTFSYLQRSHKHYVKWDWKKHFSTVSLIIMFFFPRYKAIVKFKTAFYSFYLPVALAMYMVRCFLLLGDCPVSWALN